MRTPISRFVTLSALVATGAIADAPTAAAPRGEGFSAVEALRRNPAVNSAIINAAFVNKLTGIGAGWPNRLLSSLEAGNQPPPGRTPLSVGLYCVPQPYQGYPAYDCTAYASGGNGSYTFNWAMAWEYYEDPTGISKATAPCIGAGRLDVFVQVTDSDENIAQAAYSRNC